MAKVYPREGLLAYAVDIGWLLGTRKRLKIFDWRRADPLRWVGAKPGSPK